jgi:hypothetical protein
VHEPANLESSLSFIFPDETKTLFILEFKFKNFQKITQFPRHVIHFEVKFQKILVGNADIYRSIFDYKYIM